MKMQSSLKGSRRSRTVFSSVGGGIIVGLACIALLIFLLRLFAPAAVNGLARPFWGLGTSLTAAVGNGTSQFQNNGALVAQRDQLAAENAALRAENVALATKAHDLQVTLGTRTEPAKEIVAGVLARPPVAPYDVLIVDQGSTSGVAVGAPAFGPGGTPVGRVKDLTATTARIVLYSASNTTTEGWIGAGRVPVTLTGIGSGGFEATLPKDAGIVAGDGVFVPGPGALPIGTVARIDSDPSSPTVVLHIHPYVNPFSILWVTIQPGYRL